MSEADKSPADPAKVKLAQRTATALLSTMVGIQTEVQIEATVMLLKALIITGVKSEFRLSLFNTIVQRMRVEITPVEPTKGKSNAKARH